jgi:hypothetical protein
MKGFGFLLLMVSIALEGYALFVFDPSVSTGYGNVYNVGKLQDRQNLLIVAGIGACIGTLLMLFGRSSTADSPQELFNSALESANFTLMEQMIASGAIDPNGRGPGGMQSWLRVAVNREAIQQCELLLRKGADPAMPDGFGTSVMDYLKKRGNESGALKEIKALFDRPPAVDPPIARQSTVASSTDAPVQHASLVEQLRELGHLKETGLLTTEEFEKAKARVLAS